MGLLITGLIPSIHHQVNVALGDVVYLMNGQKTFTQCCVTVFRGFEIGLTSFVFFLNKHLRAFEVTNCSRQSRLSWLVLLLVADTMEGFPTQQWESIEDFTSIDQSLIDDVRKMTQTAVFGGKILSVARWRVLWHRSTLVVGRSVVQHGMIGVGQSALQMLPSAWTRVVSVACDCAQSRSTS